MRVLCKVVVVVFPETSVIGIERRVGRVGSSRVYLEIRVMHESNTAHTLLLNIDTYSI